jgi:hypothetical protein
MSTYLVRRRVAVHARDAPHERPVLLVLQPRPVYVLEAPHGVRLPHAPQQRVVLVAAHDEPLQDAIMERAAIGKTAAAATTARASPVAPPPSPGPARNVLARLHQRCHTLGTQVLHLCVSVCASGVYPGSCRSSDFPKRAARTHRLSIGFPNPTPQTARITRTSSPCVCPPPVPNNFVEAIERYLLCQISPRTRITRTSSPSTLAAAALFTSPPHAASASRSETSCSDEARS